MHRELERDEKDDFKNVPVFRKTTKSIGFGGEEFKETLIKVNENLTQQNFDSDRAKTREIPAMLNSMDDALEVLNNNIFRLIDKLEILYSVLPEESGVSMTRLHCESPLGNKLSEQASTVRHAANMLNRLLDSIEL